MATTASDSATPSTGNRTTSVLVRFTGATGMTAEQYDETVRRLKGSGEWPPAGLDYHVAFKSGGHFRVSEIWDSSEQLDAFGKHLMPVLADVGIELSGEPEKLEIHNIIRR